MARAPRLEPFPDAVSEPGSADKQARRERDVARFSTEAREELEWVAPQLSSIFAYVIQGWHQYEDENSLPDPTGPVDLDRGVRAARRAIDHHLGLVRHGLDKYRSAYGDAQEFRDIESKLLYNERNYEHLLENNLWTIRKYIGDDGTLSPEDQTFLKRLLEAQAAVARDGTPLAQVLAEFFPERFPELTRDDKARLSIAREASAEFPNQAPALWSQDKQRGDTPVTFIKRTYEPWLSRGLQSADLRRLDPQLYNAYYTHLRRHPDDSLQLPRRASDTGAWVERVQSGDPIATAEAREMQRKVVALARAKAKDRQ